MNINELRKLDELRTAIQTLSNQTNSIAAALITIRQKVDEAYFDACEELRKTRKDIPYTMKMSIPDMVYRMQSGDALAQRRSSQ